MARGKITKTDAVRQALAALGNDAMPVRIQGWVKDNLGVEMTSGHVSTTKGEILRKAAEAAAASGPAAEAASNTVEGPISKFEAVRRALDKLGKKAKPSAIVDFVKDHFNLEMTPGHAKTNKGKILRGGKKKPGPKPGAKKAAREPLAEQPSIRKPAKGVNGKTIPLADILKLKDLVQRVGPDHLRTLIDVMGK
jgi:hypothetical protein